MNPILEVMAKYGWDMGDLEFYSAQREYFSPIRVQKNDQTIILRHISTNIVVVENSKNSQHENILLAFEKLNEKITVFNGVYYTGCPECGYSRCEEGEE